MNDHINQIIRKVGENGHISIDSNNQYLFRAALRLESENILRRNEKNFYFKDIGQHIYKLGSYEKYQIELDEQKQHQKRLDEAAIKSSNADEQAAKSAKSSANASWVSIALTFVAVGIGLLQYLDSKEKDNEINELKSKFAKLEAQLKENLSNVEQKAFPADSSSNQRDSLKK